MPSPAFSSPFLPSSCIFTLLGVQLASSGLSPTMYIASGTFWAVASQVKITLTIFAPCAIVPPAPPEPDVLLMMGLNFGTVPLHPAFIINLNTPFR